MVRRRCDKVVLSDFVIRLVMSRRGYELDSLFPFGAGVRSVLSAEDAVAGAASNLNSCPLLRVIPAIPWEWGRVPGEGLPFSVTEVLVNQKGHSRNSCECPLVLYPGFPAD